MLSSRSLLCLQLISSLSLTILLGVDGVTVPSIPAPLLGRGPDIPTYGRGRGPLVYPPSWQSLESRRHLSEQEPENISCVFALALLIFLFPTKMACLCLGVPGRRGRVEESLTIGL